MAANKAATSPASDTADRAIVLSRIFDAPRELVWDAWTDPKQVVQWWGPQGFTTTIHEMDVRPGGRWRHTMHGPDGANYPNEIVFAEVVKHERIVYSGSGRREGGPSAHFQTTWTFEDEGDKTKLTLRMVFDSSEERERVIRDFGALQGGKQTLGRLAGQLAKIPVIIERSLNAPVETVWKAITDVDHMRQWYFATLDSFKPEVGFETQFNVRHNEKDYLHIWKITEVVPGKKITCNWKLGGKPGDSFVTFELFAEGNKTKLKLTHKGLETFIPESNPDLARGNFVQGWTHFSSALKQFVETTDKAAEQDLVIIRIFNAPRELVWNAWTDPKQVAQWWGPHGFTNPVCDLDVRPGGGILVHMRGPDGVVHPMTGVYQEVVEPERLVFICAALDNEGKPLFEVLTTVIFAAQGKKTKQTLQARVIRKTAKAAPYLAGMEAGWTQSLERLAKFVIKHAGEQSS
jgi:uncharacterized protein YndB with AHSA1/START domain